MTGTVGAEDAGTPLQGEREHGHRAAGEHGGGPVGAGGVLYLSDLIADVPETRRIRFVAHFKEAIRVGQFDGCPTAETFRLTYRRRGRQGPEQCDVGQREFVVENTPVFQAWMATEVVAPGTGPKYPTRTQVEDGQVSLAEMAAKFRRRGSPGQKRRGRR